MEEKKIVVALGGNALGNTPEEQLQLVTKTASTIVDLAQEGYQVIVSHGNGPQVGMIHNAMSFSHQNGGNTPEIPFAECGAMSQGYIGYHLQQAIQNELKARHSKKNCCCLVTQVVVDEKDPAFNHPTKPVGIFYSKEEAQRLMEETGDVYKEDAGRGYRKVVASPLPIRIQELPILKALVNPETIVITIGGGGIPVIEDENGQLKGVSAVIDKDNASARLAIDMGADRLVILTAVEQVSIHFHQDNQEYLNEMTVSEAKQYIEAGEFAPGSMLPKMEACLRFVEESGKEALITSLEIILPR